MIKSTLQSNNTKYCKLIIFLKQTEKVYIPKKCATLRVPTHIRHFLNNTPDGFYLMPKFVVQELQEPVEFVQSAR